MLAETYHHVQQASDLLAKSAKLLEQVQKIAADSRYAGHEFTHTLRVLIKQESSAATTTADAGRQVARQAAAAALDIRALIGGPVSSMQQYGWASPAPRFTMVRLEQQLDELAENTSQAARCWRGNGNIDTIARGLMAMADVARANISVAVAAAEASEKLHQVARDFVRGIQA